MQACDSPSPAWSVRTVNAVMTATYWAIGRRIVEAEQRGRRHADYGERYPHYTASVATGFASTFNPELAAKRPLASVRFRADTRGMGDSYRLPKWSSSPSCSPLFCAPSWQRPRLRSSADRAA
jgi:hypothetical protein